MVKKINLIMLILITHLTLASELDNIAINCKSDKSSKSHNYAKIYEKYLRELKDKRIKFLEIGFFKGGSAKMWDIFFKNASLYFIDIDPNAFKKYGKNLSQKCHFDVLDQAKKVHLENYINKVGGNFDVIIDDGGHSMEQQINSFICLFPHVKEGGIYIIEDLHTSYWKYHPYNKNRYFGGHGTAQNPKSGPGTTIQLLKDLIDDVNIVGAKTTKANFDNCPKEIFDKMTYYQKYIESIHFYDSLCFIFKRKLVK